MAEVILTLINENFTIIISFLFIYLYFTVTKDNFPELSAGVYKVRFDTTTYFQRLGVDKFLYPYVDIVFQLEVHPFYTSLTTSSHSCPTSMHNTGRAALPHPSPDQRPRLLHLPRQLGPRTDK
jgi:hypothetical protein